MLSYLRHKMSNGKIPFEARMLSLALLLVNIPAAIAGLIFCWTILPLLGLILYGLVIAMSLGKLSVENARLTTVLTMLYHLILLIILFGVGKEPGDTLVYNWLFMMPISSIGFGQILLRVLNHPETSNTEEHV